MSSVGMNLGIDRSRWPVNSSEKRRGQKNLARKGGVVYFPVGVQFKTTSFGLLSLGCKRFPTHMELQSYPFTIMVPCMVAQWPGEVHT